jgi:hypothetical protein
MLREAKRPRRQEEQGSDFIRRPDEEKAPTKRDIARKEVGGFDIEHGKVLYRISILRLAATHNVKRST